jgi:hypothetical protein
MDKQNSTSTERELRDFNPNAMTLQISNRIPFTSRTGVQLWLIRPDGDVFLLLTQSISRIIDARTDISQQQKDADVNTWVCLIMGVAARKQAMPPHAIEVIEAETRNLYSPQIDVLWRSLELFEAVARFAMASDIELPESIKDPKRAWSRSVLRFVDVKGECNTRRTIADINRQTTKLLKARKNPHGPEWAPEEHALIEQAFIFSYFDDSTRNEWAKLPNATRRALADKRRDVATALDRLTSSYKTFATFFEKGSIEVVKFHTDGSKYTRRQRGKIVSLND